MRAAISCAISLKLVCVLVYIDKNPFLGGSWAKTNNDAINAVSIFCFVSQIENALNRFQGSRAEQFSQVGL